MPPILLISNVSESAWVTGFSDDTASRGVVSEAWIVVDAVFGCVWLEAPPVAVVETSLVLLPDMIERVRAAYEWSEDDYGEERSKVYRAANSPLNDTALDFLW